MTDLIPLRSRKSLNLKVEYKNHLMQCQASLISINIRVLRDDLGESYYMRDEVHQVKGKHLARVLCDPGYYTIDLILLN